MRESSLELMTLMRRRLSQILPAMLATALALLRQECGLADDSKWQAFVGAVFGRLVLCLELSRALGEEIVS